MSILYLKMFILLKYKPKCRSTALRIIQIDDGFFFMYIERRNEEWCVFLVCCRYETKIWYSLSHKQNNLRLDTVEIYIRITIVCCFRMCLYLLVRNGTQDFDIYTTTTP